MNLVIFLYKYHFNLGAHILHPDVAQFFQYNKLFYNSLSVLRSSCILTIITPTQ